MNVETKSELHKPGKPGLDVESCKDEGRGSESTAHTQGSAFDKVKEHALEEILTRGSEFELAKNPERFGELPSNLRAIRVRNNIDMLLVQHPIGIKPAFCAMIEIFKVIVFYATIVKNMNSCAVFSPTILLIGGLFNLFQIAVMTTKKLIRALYIITYDETKDEELYMLLRVGSIVGLGIVEVLFITATFWLLNTINDLLDAITSGLALLVVSNLDDFVFQYITLETVAHKTGKQLQNKYSKYIEVGQIVVVVVLFSVLYLIAISVATSDHSGYDAKYCA